MIDRIKTMYDSCGRIEHHYSHHPITQKIHNFKWNGNWESIERFREVCGKFKIDDDKHTRKNNPNYKGDFHSHINELWYKDIKDGFKDGDKVVEIGAGWGEFGRIILDDYKIQYWVVDLPECLVMTAKWLSENRKDLKFKLYDEEGNSDDFDIILQPPWDFNLPNVDWFINTRSFQEISKEDVDRYFNIIQDKLNLGGLFLNINRFKPAPNYYGVDDMPYDDNWITILDKPAPYQEHKIQMLLKERSV